eukprot:Gb_06385 [translate_table: standard]
MAVAVKVWVWVMGVTVVAAAAGMGMTEELQHCRGICSSDDECNGQLFCSGGKCADDPRLGTHLCSGAGPAPVPCPLGLGPATNIDIGTNALPGPTNPAGNTNANGRNC